MYAEYGEARDDIENKVDISQERRKHKMTEAERRKQKKEATSKEEPMSRRGRNRPPGTVLLRRGKHLVDKRFERTNYLWVRSGRILFHRNRTRHYRREQARMRAAEELAANAGNKSLISGSDESVEEEVRGGAMDRHFVVTMSKEHLLELGAGDDQGMSKQVLQRKTRQRNATKMVGEAKKQQYKSRNPTLKLQKTTNVSGATVFPDVDKTGNAEIVRKARNLRKKKTQQVSNTALGTDCISADFKAKSSHLKTKQDVGKTNLDNSSFILEVKKRKPHLKISLTETSSLETIPIKPDYKTRKPSTKKSKLYMNASVCTSSIPVDLRAESRQRKAKQDDKTNLESSSFITEVKRRKPRLKISVTETSSLETIRIKPDSKTRNPRLVHRKRQLNVIATVGSSSIPLSLRAKSKQRKTKQDIDKQLEKSSFTLDAKTR